MLGMPRDGKDSTYSRRDIIGSVSEFFSRFSNTIRDLPGGTRCRSSSWNPSSCLIEKLDEIYSTNRRRSVLLFSDLKKRMRFSSWNWKTVLPYSEQVGLNSPRWIVRFVIVQKIAIFPYYPKRPYLESIRLFIILKYAIFI